MFRYEQYSKEHPYRSLAITFLSWKLLLLLLAALSPGAGYDTSTTLTRQPSIDLQTNILPEGILTLLADKLTRWDAIYFTKIANRGYVYEQEWAFGWGINYPMAFGAAVVRKVLDVSNTFPLESVIGIAIAHISHGLSVLVLHELTREIMQGGKHRNLAVLVACLHIVSPAGIFLSAPYGESSFALLNFTGYLLFVRGVGGKSSTSSDVSIVSAGLVLGVATMVRSNGLLNGILFLEEAIFNVATLFKQNKLAMGQLPAILFGGALIAAGYAMPQTVAYLEYCGSISYGNFRPWCQNKPPSIFSFVQSHYWNVGFLRYWTLPNTPLFLLATPMLVIMSISAYSALDLSHKSKPFVGQLSKIRRTKNLEMRCQREKRLLRSLAIPQMCLVTLTFLSFHVQIITRISSAYPIWYIWLAERIARRNTTNNGKGEKNDVIVFNELWMTRLLVMYAIVQAGLFASFLPPA